MPPKQNECLCQIPEKLRFLVDEPHRFKVLHGGRGSGKSWTVARILVSLAYVRQLRIMCVRETQISISGSVHQLLKDQIEALGLLPAYEIQNQSIRCKTTGSEFMFAGIRSDPDKIKSTEGIDICWAEEAENITENSWRALIPTIRKPDSEIWVTFNPKFSSDATSKRFIHHPPPSARVQEVNWSDNPWFPKVLETDRLHDKNTLTEEEYSHIWEGKFRPLLLGKTVYPEFRRELHVSQTSLLPDRGCQIIAGWDNTGLSPAIVLSRVNNVGQWLIFKEFCFSDTGIMDAVEALVKWSAANLPPGCTFRHIGDPAGKNRDSTKQSPADYISQKAAEMGWSIKIEDGIQTWKIRRESVATRLTKLVNGLPAVLIDAIGCPVVCDGFGGGYAYPEIGTSGIYKDEPADSIYTHPMDAIQYVATILFSLKRHITPVQAVTPQHVRGFF